MSKKILITVGILIVLSVTFLRAADFKTPHRFKPGDVISADVLNEIFDYIESSKKTMTPSDLVGEWVCTKYTPLSNAGIPIPYPPGYVQSNGGLFYTLQNIALNISEDPNGSIKWSSLGRNAFNSASVVTDSNLNPTGRYSDECPGNGIFDAVEGDFAVSYNNCVSNVSGWGPPVFTSKVSIKKISDTRLRFDGVQNASLLCDLQNVPPAEPLDLSAVNSDNNVTLSWADNSNDEEGFTIVRKDSLDGNWAEIATIGANAASYIDNVTSKGTYWYRVKAYNNNGNSLGSNVVKITIE